MPTTRPITTERTPSPDPLCGVKGCPDHPVNLPASLDLYPLDLTPLLGLREQAAALEDRLRHADATAVAPARSLAAQVEAHADALIALLEYVARHSLGFVAGQRCDVVALLEMASGTGNLGPMAELCEELATYSADNTPAGRFLWVGDLAPEHRSYLEQRAAELREGDPAVTSSAGSIDLTGLPERERLHLVEKADELRDRQACQ